MDGWHKQCPIRDNTYASASLLFLESICHLLRTAVIISPFSPTPLPVANFFRVVGGKTIILEIPDEKRMYFTTPPSSPKWTIFPNREKA